MPKRTRPSMIHATDVDRRAALGVLEPFHRRELHRLVHRDMPRGPVARDDLQRHDRAGNDERDQEADPSVRAHGCRAAARARAAWRRGSPVTMNAARIMCVASGHSDVLNSAAHGCTSTTFPSTSRNPVGVFMNPFAATTKNADATPGDADRHAAPEVHLRRQPVPAVEVDADEDRLGEEREALDRERQAHDVAVGGHPPRPEDPELERQDRARDRADREQHREHLRPRAGPARCRRDRRCAGPSTRRT